MRLNTGCENVLQNVLQIFMIHSQLIRQYSECDNKLHKASAPPFLTFYILRYQSESGPVLIPNSFLFQ